MLRRLVRYRILILVNIFLMQIPPAVEEAEEEAVLKRIRRSPPMKQNVIILSRNSLIICLVNMITYPRPKIALLVQIAYVSWIKKLRNWKNRSPRKNVMSMRLILIILKTAQPLPRTERFSTKMALLLTMNRLCKNSQISLMPRSRMKPKNLIMISKTFSINTKKLQSLNYLKLIS